MRLGTNGTSVLELRILHFYPFLLRMQVSLILGGWLDVLGEILFTTNYNKEKNVHNMNSFQEEMVEEKDK